MQQLNSTVEPEPRWEFPITVQTHLSIDGVLPLMTPPDLPWR